MTTGSVAINRLVLWHVPCVHDNRFAIDGSSAGIGLALALVTAATRATPAVLKAAAGVTIIRNGRVCHMLVIITGLGGKNRMVCRERGEGTGETVRVHVQGWQP